MNHDERKAAVAAYKERKLESGIYAIRCEVGGKAWVGIAPDLATIKNRHWFALRQGSHPATALQAAWAAHGDGAFTFEILERIGDEIGGFTRECLLKELRAEWAAKLAADRL